ncbi:holin [Streptomyces sp. sk2.1]|uniref:holin n=1 Tax=Streptomyces sp. sk2.1 TaxID=2478959 RepID=UPI0011E8711D|nr:holin [Streptomyces sp. sk2.1]TXS78705.1 holin [Streptomyces sp. sk2.1]
MTGTVFSGSFWAATAERTVRTAAQTLLAAVGLTAADVLDADWGQALALAGGAALLAVLTALSTAGAGAGGGPGLTETVRERER